MTSSGSAGDAPLEQPDWFSEFQKHNTADPGSAPGALTPQERRKHPRFKIDEADAVLRRMGFSLFGGQANMARTAVDLSEGGVRIITTERVVPGVKVKVTIGIQKYNDSLETEAEVKWSHQNMSNGSEFYAGVMFLDLALPQVTKIARMRAWFTSAQYQAIKEKRTREKGSGLFLK